jgi:hypothetical protein
VKAINAESQRNDSIVPLAATIVAPGAFNCFVFMKRIFTIILVIWVNEVD